MQSRALLSLNCHAPAAIRSTFQGIVFLFRSETAPVPDCAHIEKSICSANKARRREKKSSPGEKVLNIFRRERTRSHGEGRKNIRGRERAKTKHLLFNTDVIYAFIYFSFWPRWAALQMTGYLEIDHMRGIK